MGCLYSKSTGLECLQQIETVDSLLAEMLKKYQNQYDDLGRDIRGSLRTSDRRVLVHKLRRQKVILHYMDACRRKMEALMQKRYAIEQLSITKLQLDALKSSAKVLKTFAKEHSIEKIEDLQDTLEELTTQILDVNTCLSEAAPLVQFDDLELERELDMLQLPDVPVERLVVVDEGEVGAPLVKACVANDV